jgi:hypothetical protein
MPIAVIVSPFVKIPMLRFFIGLKCAVRFVPSTKSHFAIATRATRMLRRVALSSLRCASRRASVHCFKALAAVPGLCRPSGAMATTHRSPFLSAHFSTDAPAPPHMSEHEFMELADETLHEIQSWLDGIEEMLEESDVMFSVRRTAVASPRLTRS